MEVISGIAYSGRDGACRVRGNKHGAGGLIVLAAAAGLTFALKRRQN